MRDKIKKIMAAKKDMWYAIGIIILTAILFGAGQLAVLVGLGSIGYLGLEYITHEDGE